MLFADEISPPVSAHQLLTGWQHDLVPNIFLAVEVLLVVWYLWSAGRLGARGRRWSRWRSASFVAGMALIVIAVQSGLASYDDSVFTIHVTQHLLLMNFAPILIALGAPMTLALQASSRRTQQGLLKILHNPIVEGLTHPAVVVALGYATMIVYFVTPLYRLSLEHQWFHDLTHVHFLVSGSLFWWLVVGLDPSRWRLSHAQKVAILAIGVPVTAVLGLTLTGDKASVAPMFHTVADTHAGGALLWVVGELTTLVALGIVVYQWLRAEERRAQRADRQADALEAASAAAAGAAPPPG